MAVWRDGELENLPEGVETEGAGPSPLTPLPAEDVIAQIIEPDNGGMLPWRRRTASSPVLTFTDRYVVGELDLRAVEYPYLLEFVRCQFERPPDLRQARFAGCQFSDCQLPGLRARNLATGSNLVLARCAVEGAQRAEALIDLTDATIAGSLNLQGSRLINPHGRALQADRLQVAGALLGKGLTVRGVLRLAGARTGGNVDLAGADLRHDNGLAFNGTGMHVGGNLICSAGSDRAFSSTGLMYLTSAEVSNDFYLRGAVLQPSDYRSPAAPYEDPQHDPIAVLVADRLSVTGNVVFDRRATSTGTLRMVDARIGGSLRFNGITVDISSYQDDDAPPLHALHFDGTQIRGDFDLRHATTTGQARLADLWVRGSLYADYAKFRTPDGDAVDARRLSVGGNIEARDTRIEGSLLMPGATIGATLDLRASRLTSTGQRKGGGPKSSLDIRGAQIAHDLICAAGRNPFCAEGGVRMHRAVIGRGATFDGAILGSDTADNALNAFGMTAQDLILTLGEPPEGTVILRHAHCATLADNAAFWRARTTIDLEEFRYDALAEPIALKDDHRVRTRIRWLEQTLGHDTYRPGPYDQLATMLRDAGNEEHAATVLMAKQVRRYRALAGGYHRVLAPLVLLWSWLQRWMVGYGYRPMRALGWLVLLLVLGSIWFSVHVEDCTGFVAGTRLAGHCSVSVDDTGLVWNPFLYTVDLLVPIIDFGNKGRWHMTGIDQWVSSAFIAAGWILATTVAAGLTRLIRRQ